MHPFVDFVKSRVIGWQPSSGGWVIGNCPVCVRMGEKRPDYRRRGGFHFESEKWAYHCFNCGFKIAWDRGTKLGERHRILLECLGVDQSDIQRMSIELLREEEAIAFLNPLPEEKPKFTPSWPVVSLPEKSVFLNDESQEIHMTETLAAGIRMLADRKILHWEDWAYAGSNLKFKNRIILPYRYKGNIVGYSARYIGKAKKNVPKYIVSKPPHFVFNLDRQTSKQRKYVIVTEGDFDAISIDGVSLGSNSLNENQASLINQLNRKVILLPDADLAGSALIEPAISQGWDVAFPEWMEYYKDANEASLHYGRCFVLQSIINSATGNPTKIRVLAKKFLC